MLELDTILAVAVERGDLPYGVAAITRGDGSGWMGSAGDVVPGTAADPDTFFSLFSMTKAVGALAALILVDRGLVSLETEVREVLPEFDNLLVVESVGPAGPITRPAARPATLRHLLTHTSGLALNAFNEKMFAYQEAMDIPPSLTGTLDSWRTALMFDPGDGWAYGIGPEWVGRVVQEVSGVRLDRFCRDEIFQPLRMTHATFEVDESPLPLAQCYERTATGSFAPVDYSIPGHPEMYSLGFGIYCTAPDFVRFLRLVLNQGELDGTRVIAPVTARFLTDNLMPSGNVPILEPYIPTSRRVDYLFDQTPMTHSAAGVRTELDIPGMRRAGSVWWAGFLNTFWWIDPESDVAGILMTQSLPFCDEGFMRTWGELERAAYQHISSPAKG